jgi:hypothetical protein
MKANPRFEVKEILRSVFLEVYSRLGSAFSDRGGDENASAAPEGRGLGEGNIRLFVECQ